MNATLSRLRDLLDVPERVDGLVRRIDIGLQLLQAMASWKPPEPVPFVTMLILGQRMSGELAEPFVDGVSGLVTERELQLRYTAQFPFKGSVFVCCDLSRVEVCHIVQGIGLLSNASPVGYMTKGVEVGAQIASVVRRRAP